MGNCCTADRKSKAPNARVTPINSDLKVPVIINGHQFSQPARSVQWFVDYTKKNADVKFVDVFGAGAHKAPEYVAKFPAGQVPTMEDGDFYLEESVAIIQYLANGTEFDVPKDTKEASKLKQSLARHLALVRKFSSEVVVPMFFAPEDEKKEKIAKGIENVTPALQRYNTLFGSQKYINGDKLTLADFMFAPEVDQYKMIAPLIGTDILASYPNILSYLDRLAKLDGYTNSFNTAQSFLNKSS